MAEIERKSIHFEGAGQHYDDVHSELRGLHEPHVSWDAYFDRLDEINDTWRIIHDPETGEKFEIAIVNQDYIDKDVILFPSTDFSSLTQNMGNAIELAASGAEKPHTAIIYVAFPGNGGSRSLNTQERGYFAKTGRLTYEDDGRPGTTLPLPTIASMAHAITNHYRTPNHLSADINGARLGTALMAAFREGTVEDAYWNGITGISPNAHYSSAMLREDIAGRAERHGAGRDYLPGETTGQAYEDAAPHLGRIYPGLGKLLKAEGRRHYGLLAKTYGLALRNALLVNQRAFSGNNDLGDLENHAVYRDTMAALMRQEAMITMEFKRDSSLHDLNDCIRFGRLVMEHIPEGLRSDRRGVELIISTGSLDEHTVNPAGRMASERYGLRSIAQFMRLVLPRGASTITEVPADEERLAA